MGLAPGPPGLPDSWPSGLPTQESGSLGKQQARESGTLGPVSNLHSGAALKPQVLGELVLLIKLKLVSVAASKRQFHSRANFVLETECGGGSK